MPRTRCCNLPAVTLVLGVTACLLAGCRSTPLHANGDTAPTRLCRAEVAWEADAGASSSWVRTKATYDRVGLRPTAWVATAEGEAQGGGGGGGGDLAKAAQNPIASLISVPFQNNTSFGIGPENRTQNVLNIQPVVPVSLWTWSLVNRMIIPVVHQPDPSSAERAWDGIGDINLTSFVVPPAFGPVMVGAGPIVQFPSASSTRVGSQMWAAGPSAVVVATLDKWVLGLLVNNIWGLEGDGADDLNRFTAQYFVNYNLPKGWYLTSAPLITADWNAPSDDRWTVPFGGGIGKIFKIGKQSCNAGVQAYYNVVTPDGGPEWSLRCTVTLLFPK
jgi:hypothetical protein